MPSMERERKLLQQSVAIVATLPVAAGLYGVLFGQALTGDAVSISAESHFRFVSGVLLGIGQRLREIRARRDQPEQEERFPHCAARVAGCTAISPKPLRRLHIAANSAYAFSPSSSVSSGA